MNFTNASRPPSLATQAWAQLSSAIDTRTHGLRDSAAGLVDATSGRVGSGAREAHRRAYAAMDALAGRRPPTRWGWLAAAVALGLAVGAAATTAAGQRFGVHHDDLR